MCAGSVLLFKIKRIVIGENKNMSGREEFLRSQGVEVVVLEDAKAKVLLTNWIDKNRDAW